MRYAPLLWINECYNIPVLFESNVAFRAVTSTPKHIYLPFEHIFIPPEDINSHEYIHVTADMSRKYSREERFAQICSYFIAVMLGYVLFSFCPEQFFPMLLYIPTTTEIVILCDLKSGTWSRVTKSD